MLWLGRLWLGGLGILWDVLAHLEALDGRDTEGDVHGDTSGYLGASRDS